jgi:hypothetical protein
VRGEPCEDPPKVIKSYNVTLETPLVESVVPGNTLKRKGIGYSLTGITSGVVKKRQEGGVAKTCGIFAKDWPKGLTVEGEFDLKL